MDDGDDNNIFETSSSWSLSVMKFAAATASSVVGQSSSSLSPTTTVEEESTRFLSPSHHYNNGDDGYDYDENSSSSSSSSDNSSSNINHVAAFYGGLFSRFIWFVPFAVLFLVRMRQLRWSRSQNQNSRSRSNDNEDVIETITDDDGDDYDHHSFTIEYSTFEDRSKLYSMTFDHNGNQLKLQQKHIVVEATKNTTKNKTTDDVDKQKKSRSKRNFVTNSNDDDDEKQDDDTFDENDDDDDDNDIELGGAKNINTCDSIAAINDEDSSIKDDDDDNDNNDRSVYLSIESERKLYTAMDEFNSKSQQQPDNYKHESSDGHHQNKKEEKTEKMKKKNRDDDDDKCSISRTTTSKKIDYDGTCIICFEDFKKDDVIVWSENRNCNHVYHKDCMVRYLASNATRNKTANNHNDVGSIYNNENNSNNSNHQVVLDCFNRNPCPTCRQINFCTVRDEHLIGFRIKNEASAIMAAAAAALEPSTLLSPLPLR